MSIEVAVILFIAGVILVVKGGDLFVDAASWIAKASGIPSFIVGATIVSLATTLPEMIVSVLAALQGKTEMAIGNAVGSVTANTGLILAVAMIFMPIAIQRKDYVKHCGLLIAAAAVLLGFSLSGALSLAGSLILIVIFLISMAENVRNAMKQQEDGERIQTTRKETGRRIVMFLFGALGIVAGSQLLVNSGSALAAFFGGADRSGHDDRDRNFAAGAGHHDHRDCQKGIELVHRQSDRRQYPGSDLDPAGLFLCFRSGPAGFRAESGAGYAGLSVDHPAGTAAVAFQREGIENAGPQLNFRVLAVSVLRSLNFI